MRCTSCLCPEELYRYAIIQTGEEQNNAADLHHEGHSVYQLLVVVLDNVAQQRECYTLLNCHVGQQEY